MAISTKSRFPENIQLVAPAGTNAALEWLASIRQAQALLNKAKAIGMAWARPGSRYLVPLSSVSWRALAPLLVASFRARRSVLHRAWTRCRR